MTLIATTDHDVMQVCRNGHVITDLVNTFPERALSHCDRCGAVTLRRCLTCGHEIPGALYVPEAVPVGLRRPPQFCSCCGAAFPWTTKPGAASAPRALAVLEKLLRRLPRVVHQFRSRHADRPAFCVKDEHDLEDLLRALLPLHFDDIRLENRTPSYALGTRTDFWLSPSMMVLTAKTSSRSLHDKQLAEEIREDIGYYQAKNHSALVCFVYDPEQRCADPARLEIEWAALADDLRVKPVIAT